LLLRYSQIIYPYSTYIHHLYAPIAHIYITSIPL
jgi:hypothetical protein